MSKEMKEGLISQGVEYNTALEMLGRHLNVLIP